MEYLFIIYHVIGTVLKKREKENKILFNFWVELEDLHFHIL